MIISVILQVLGGVEGEMVVVVVVVVVGGGGGTGFDGQDPPPPPPPPPPPTGFEGQDSWVQGLMLLSS